MKEKIAKNLGIKLLSLPLAVVIWILIINLDDPILTKSFSNIPVTILNESYITSSDQVYDVVEGSSVTVTVKAKQSIINKIRPVDLQATADLATVNQFNRVEIEASCPKYDYDIADISAKPKMLTITLEDSITDTKSVQVVTSGDVANGYSLGGAEAIPNMVEISGAESVIRKIAEVRVNVSVSGKSESFTAADLIPSVYDEDGEQIDSSRLVFSSPSIKVRVTIYSNKKIPISIDLDGDPAYGFSIIKTAYDPETIEVTGSQEDLAKVSKITIPVDVSGSSRDVEKNIDLAESGYLPDGVKIVGDVTSVAIRVTVEKMSIREFTLSRADIEVMNVPDRMEFAFASADISVKVNLMGIQEELSKITKDTLGAYIDLSGLKAGTHSVEVKIADLENGIRISGVRPKITVILSKIKNNAPTEEPEDTIDSGISETPKPTLTPEPTKPVVSDPPPEASEEPSGEETEQPPKDEERTEE